MSRSSVEDHGGCYVQGDSRKLMVEFSTVADKKRLFDRSVLVLKEVEDDIRPAEKWSLTYLHFGSKCMICHWSVCTEI
jgi:hypothetical protein